MESGHSLNSPGIAEEPFLHDEPVITAAEGLLLERIVFLWIRVVFARGGLSCIAFAGERQENFLYGIVNK